MGNITSYSEQSAPSLTNVFSSRDSSPKLFDPLAWLASPEQSVPLGTLLERRVGFPAATVLRDVTPPSGMVVMNDSLESGGIRIHHLAVKNAAGTAYLTSDTFFVQDDLDEAVRPGTVLGGAQAQSQYEILGEGTARSLALFCAPSSGVYPQVGAIEFGVTSRKTKQYMVEVKRPGDRWRPLVSMISSEATRDYFLVPLTGDPRLCAVRIRYTGDYYTPTATGNVTASAYDLSSGVEAVQLSHYPDFRDSHDVSALTIGDLPGGWMPFEEGTSIYDWSHVNQDRFWLARAGIAYNGLRLLTPVGTSGDYVAADLYNLYAIEKGTLTIQYHFPGETVAALTSHQGRIYAATSAGRIFVTDTGKSYDLALILPVREGASTPPPVLSLASYKGRLYIGTGASSASDETAGRGLVYSWDGTLLRLVFSIGEAGTEVDVSALCSASDRLFVGTRVDSGLLAKIYAYDGVGLSLVLNPLVSAVQALGFVTLDGRLWAGLSDGRIQALTFSGSTLGIWQDVYSGSAETYYQIVGLLSENFVWVPNDTGLLAYVEDVAGESKFLTVSAPPSYTTGLTADWYNTPSNWTTIPGGSPVFTGTDGPIHWPDLGEERPTGVILEGNVAVWTGFLRAFDSGSHIFYLRVDDGVRLYIDGKKVLDKWFLNPGVEYTVRVELVAGQWVPFQLEYFAAGSTSTQQSISLSWSTPRQITKHLVPRDAFTPSLESTTANLHAVTLAGSKLIAAGSDGRVYELDTEILRAKKRFVYARFRDRAGNVTSLPGIQGGAEGIPNKTYIDPLEPAKVVMEGIFDSVMEGGERGPDGSVKTQGRIWQVATASKVVGSTTYQPGDLLSQYISDDTAPLFSPDRLVRERGFFESDPFYVATLSAWDNLDVFATISAPPTPEPPDAGMENGAEVLIYTRAAATREECLAVAWGVPVRRSTIITPGSTGALHTVANLQTVIGNWLQFKIELVTASKNLTPVINSATLSYSEAGASYFFTKIFDTSTEVNAPPYPLWRRGLLTENSLANGGRVLYGYTTDDDPNTTFEFSRYTPIIPNRVFELPNPATKIRFGILLASLDGDYQAIVNDFAVQLDAGDADLYLMK